MMMRWRLRDAQPDRELSTMRACAATREDADECAAVLSRGGVVAIVDYGDHEEPEIRAVWQNGVEVRRG